MVCTLRTTLPHHTLHGLFLHSLSLENKSPMLYQCSTHISHFPKLLISRIRMFLGKYQMPFNVIILITYLFDIQLS
jgi:hypothetical protein